MTAPLARSSDEAHLYMELHPCACGEAEFGSTSSVTEVDGVWLVRYWGSCEECGRERSFEFRQPEHQELPGEDAWAAGDARSELLDPGEWLFVADTYASVPADAAELAPDRRERARTDLLAAAAAVDEVLRFLPAGADAVPAGAFWSGRGRTARDTEPARFQKTALERSRDAYRRAAAELAARPA